MYIINKTINLFSREASPRCSSGEDKEPILTRSTKGRRKKIKFVSFGLVGTTILMPPPLVKSLDSKLKYSLKSFCTPVTKSYGQPIFKAPKTGQQMSQLIFFIVLLNALKATDSKSFGLAPNLCRGEAKP